MFKSEKIDNKAREEIEKTETELRKRYTSLETVLHVWQVDFGNGTSVTIQAAHYIIQPVDGRLEFYDDPAKEFNILFIARNWQSLRRVA